MTDGQQQQQGNAPDQAEPDDKLMQNQRDQRDRDSDDDAPGESQDDASSEGDPGENLIRNPLDKPDADDMNDNSRDK